jgi:hypothetical protein
MKQAHTRETTGAAATQETPWISLKGPDLGLMKAWTPDQVGGDKFGVGGDS